MAWLTFIKERFDPLSHFVMIALFVGVHALYSSTSSLNSFALLFVASTFFFFNLRLYDEIKDYQTDLQINPTRPLPRGLLRHKDLYQVIVLCISTFLIITLSISLDALIMGICTILYSLLMYKEFFIADFLAPKLTTYAMTHTFVTILLSLTLLVSFKGLSIAQLSLEDLSFAFSSWFFFNIFEFGRKTFLQGEERKNVDTYSSLFGKKGACALSFSQALIGSLLLSYSLNSYSILLFLPLIYMLFISIPFLFKESGPWGKIYRAGTSFYIVLTYVLLSLKLNFF